MGEGLSHRGNPGKHYYPSHRGRFSGPRNRDSMYCCWGYKQVDIENSAGQRQGRPASRQGLRGIRQIRALGLWPGPSRAQFPTLWTDQEEALPCSGTVAATTGAAKVLGFKGKKKKKGMWVVMRALCGGNIFYTLKRLFDLF